MKTTPFLALFLIATSCGMSVAQTNEQADLNAALRSRIAVAARSQEDGILLRWAADKPAVWQDAKRTGFVVERADAPTSGVRPSGSTFKAVSGAAITPWESGAWEAYFKSVPPASGALPDFAMLAAALSENADGETEVRVDDLSALQEQKARFEMRYGMALYAADRNATAAEGLGLRFLDKTAEKGKAYVYRVRLAERSKIYLVDTGYVHVVHALSGPQASRLVTATENDGWILLSWPGRRWSAVRVEKSTDNGRSFANITRVPVISVRDPQSPDSNETYADTLVTNYRPNIYRVYGATPFADEELIGEVKATGRDRTAPGAPFVPNARQIRARAVRIAWSMDEPVAGDLNGFRVLRDSIESGTYPFLTIAMLSKETREFIDTTFSEHDPNYYIVAAYDTAGNVSRSLPSYVAIVDSTSPGIPRWFKGTMDSTGVVRLVLHANPERDVMGYRILRANAPEHEFSSVYEWFGKDGISAAQDTVILDTVTVQSLTKNVYYRATALDFHFNESALSEILRVARPDKVAPVAPVITDVELTDSSAVIHFTPGGSDDVEAHLLYKRVSGATAWETPARIAADAVVASDKDVKPNVMLEYALQAVDSAGNRSGLSMSVLARPYRNTVLPVVRDLTARYDDAKRQMILTWQYARETEGLRFMIYRSANGSGLKKYAVADDAKTKSFLDTSLQGRGSYEYAIKVMSDVGAESGMSETVSTVVK